MSTHTPYRRLPALVLFFVTAAHSAYSSANLILNGQFELGNYVSNVTPSCSGGCVSLGAGTSALQNWSIVSSELDWLSAGSFGLVMSGRFLDLTALQQNDPLAGVSQTVSTDVGATYRLSYLIGTASRYTALGRAFGIDVSTTGNSTVRSTITQATTPASGTNILQTVDFQATSALTTVTLQGWTSSSSGLAYLGLDDVQLTLLNPAPDDDQDMPTPATLGLFALGIICMRFRRRLRA